MNDSSDYGKTYRNLQIIRAFLQGEHPANIARRFDVTRQRVDQILKRADGLLYTEPAPDPTIPHPETCWFSTGKKRAVPCGRTATKVIVAGGKIVSMHFACDAHVNEMIERGKRSGIPILRIEDAGPK